jgi:hypothetical protein
MVCEELLEATRPSLVYTNVKEPRKYELEIQKEEVEKLNRNREQTSSLGFECDIPIAINVYVIANSYFVYLDVFFNFIDCYFSCLSYCVENAV